MQGYGITYSIRGKEGTHMAIIDAKDAKSAKRKIGKKHGYKDGKMIQIKTLNIVAYF